MFEELIKKALKGVGLPEELYVFVNVEKEDEIIPKIATMRKLVPKPVEPKKFEKVEDLLADPEIAALVNPWKDQNVTKGINTFKEKHPEIKTEDPQPNPTGFKLEESKAYKAMQESLKSITATLEQFKTKETTQQRQSIIKKSLTEAGVPESMHKHFVVPESADETAISQAATEYKQTLTDLGLKAMTKPGDPAGISTSDATVNSYAKDKNDKGAQGGQIPGKKLVS